jgi:hypothetical protein
MLFNNDADVNIQNVAFGTALQAASTEGYKEIVKMLPSKGTCVNMEAGVFGTALYLASKEGD